MSRTLPPRPDFTQLKHQAKDLLRAHEHKDAAACAVLRRLRQFSAKNASDDAILAQPLALHEAQYALAMDYGFTSWNAMKRYVEKVTGRPSLVRREKDRTYIIGPGEAPDQRRRDAREFHHRLHRRRDGRPGRRGVDLRVPNGRQRRRIPRADAPAELVPQRRLRPVRLRLHPGRNEGHRLPLDMDRHHARRASDRGH